MRRGLFLGLGLLELAAAGLLVFLSLQLPRAAEVEKGFGQATDLTAETRTQLTFLRDQLDSVNHPQFGGLREASDGLGSLAQGMEAWANALDPAMIRQLRQGTREFAAFLEEQVAPAAARSAARLDAVTATFHKDALALSRLLKSAPPDLRAAREIHGSLAGFGEGLEKMTFLISAERLRTMREGFQGMEQSLETGAEQVERLAGFTYPIIRFNGLKPEIDEKPFWPEGEKIASGMRKGAKAMKEANREFEAQAANLPQIQKSLDESKKTVATLRKMLDGAVKNQDELDAVLRTLPENTAKLAEELPKLAEDFQKMLRETERLKEISTGLHQAQELLGAAEKSWPDARKGLLESAVQLRSLKEKIASGLEGPGTRLGKQQHSLDNLSTNLEAIQGSLPAASQTVAGVVEAVRWLLWVAAGVLLLHALYLQTRATPAPAAQ